jgi:hypothetical protein
LNRAGILKHLEKILYLVLGASIVVSINLCKERVIDVPEYRIEAKIRAPLTKAPATLVNATTGEKYDLGDTEGPNPIEVLLENTGKKPIENLEVVLEFISKGEFSLFDEEYSSKPEKGFGKITFRKPTNTERHVKMALFNPGDKFIYLATGNWPVTIIAYSKFPGLSFYQEYSPTGKYDNMIRFSMIGFIGLVAGYCIFLFCFVQKQIIEQYGVKNILSRGLVNVYWKDRTRTERLFFWAGLFLGILSCLSLAILINQYIG